MKLIYSILEPLPAPAKTPIGLTGLIKKTDVSWSSEMETPRTKNFNNFEVTTVEKVSIFLNVYPG